jgi:hypothetical protein
MLLLVAASLQAWAAIPPDLYAAEVDAGAGQARAFGDALQRVLVKMTGSRDATADGLGDPAALVQQYRTLPDGRLWISFDPAALRRALDATNQPIWGEERPATLVWLAVDAGRGQREIVAAEPPPGGMTGGADSLGEARDALVDAGRDRGLPLLLPLVDSADLAAVSFADLWGDFTGPVTGASARYGADAILIGRARDPDPARARVQWTLLAGGDRYDWTGGIADGPEGAADRLAATLAAQQGGLRLVRLQVSAVDSVDAYGAVLAYLSGLSVVESCAVELVEADRVLFGLRVRGDVDQLMRTLALQRLLLPTDPATPSAEGAPAADLHYRVIGGPESG